MTAPITVIKRNAAGREVMRYEGIILECQPDRLVVEAFFKLTDVPFEGIVIRSGDRFLETYFTGRWYNIFEIHDREADRLKGWYCNICKPVEFESSDRISYVDLALDLWVAPDGTQTVLDEDEFAALHLDEKTNSMARAAMDELRRKFLNNREAIP
jgi:uncharacterized protein